MISVYAQNARLRKRVAALRKRLEEEMKLRIQMETQLRKSLDQATNLPASKFIEMMKKTGKVR